LFCFVFLYFALLYFAYLPNVTNVTAWTNLPANVCDTARFSSTSVIRSGIKSPANQSLTT
jgi:hypothetical protein